MLKFVIQVGGKIDLKNTTWMFNADFVTFYAD